MTFKTEGWRSWMIILKRFLLKSLVVLMMGSLMFIILRWQFYQEMVARPFVFNESTPESLSQNRTIEEAAKDLFQASKLLGPDQLQVEVGKYHQQLLNHLEIRRKEAGEKVLSEKVKNVFHVPKLFKGEGFPRVSAKHRETDKGFQIVCKAVKDLQIRTLLQGNPIFKGQQLDQYMPKVPLDLLDNGREDRARNSDGNKERKEVARFKTCGVVSNAASMLNSGLGSLIDANDYVIRFNAAPTKGYERDVGTKTSLRILNSQVMAGPRFGFLEDKNKHLFSESPLLIWDESAYNITLARWFSHPYWPIFDNYISKRRMFPDLQVHILDPSSLWSIWHWLQSFYKDYPIMPVPPSSGFIALVLAMLNCATVHVYELVPSMRLTKQCHYFQKNEEGCTKGFWHPLEAEKLTALDLNIANQTEVFVHGYLRIPGYLRHQLGVPQFQCLQTGA